MYFITMAVHTELASDLTNNTFLKCLKRLISRHGTCSLIHSNNTTNCIGAGNELEKINSLLSKTKKMFNFLTFVQKIMKYGIIFRVYLTVGV